MIFFSLSLRYWHSSCMAVTASVSSLFCYNNRFISVELCVKFRLTELSLNELCYLCFVVSRLPGDYRT